MHITLHNSGEERQQQKKKKIVSARMSSLIIIIYTLVEELGTVAPIVITDFYHKFVKLNSIGLERVPLKLNRS